MNTVAIFKYTNDLIFNGTSYENPNYFRSGFLDNYVDKIILIDSILNFPEFTEEWNNQDDFNTWKTGAFDIIISPLFNEKSVNNVSVEDFFYGESKDCRYLVVFEPKECNTYEDLMNRRAGFIKPNTIDFDKTIRKNRYQIKFSVSGMLSELADLYITDDIKGDTYNGVTNDDDAPTIIEYIWGGDADHSLFGAADIGVFGIKDCLNFKARLGWDKDPVLSCPLYKNLFSDNSSSNGGNMNRWVLFKELAKGFGFVYRFVCTSILTENIRVPFFELNLLWRSGGMKHVDIPIVEELVESVSNIYANRWIYQASHHEIWGDLIKITFCMGWASNGVQIYNYDKVIVNTLERDILEVAKSSERWAFSGTDLIIVPSGVPQNYIHWNFVFSFKEILYTSSAMPGKFLAGATTFARCFVRSWVYITEPMTAYQDWGTVDIKAACPLTEYKFLCSGVKIIKKMKIFMDDIFELSLFCTTTSFGDGKTYWCQRIDNINYLKQSAEVEFVEV